MLRKLEDIVDRAREVADLENSNYISDKELCFLLNEAYDKVYADLININDRYYLKTIKVAGPEVVLPEDFFVLSQVMTNFTPIPRKPNTVNSGSFSGYYYDLNKDRLKIYGNYAGHITIEYYPVPEPIIWPISTTEPITDIDLPNNIAFSYFCYVMAMKMKMKQGADFQAIQVLASEQLETYIQLQHRDQFGSTRVGNIYNSTGFIV